MIKVLIFKGPNSKFEEIIEEHSGNALSLYEILESRKSDDLGGTEITLKDYYGSIIINSNDFSTLSETGEKIINHLLSTFIKIFDIEYVFIQNPTMTVEKKIKLMAKKKR